MVNNCIMKYCVDMEALLHIDIINTCIFKLLHVWIWPPGGARLSVTCEFERETNDLQFVWTSRQSCKLSAYRGNHTCVIVEGRGRRLLTQYEHILLWKYPRRETGLAHLPENSEEITAVWQGFNRAYQLWKSVWKGWFTFTLFLS